MRVAFISVTAGFCLFCGWLARPAYGDRSGSDANSPAKEAPQLRAADTICFGVNNAPARTITLGSVDRKSGFKFRVELSSKGAAIRKVALSEFNDGNYKDPQPLTILSPVQEKNGNEVLAMANGSFVFVEPKLQLPLDKLHWQTFDVETSPDGSQMARFEAIIKVEDTGRPAVKLVKTYKVIPNSYLLDCRLTIENLTDTEQKVQFNLTGPVGIGPEGVGADTRKVVAGFRDSQGQITGIRINATSFDSHKTFDEEILGGKEQKNQEFLWAAVVNKYFAAIVVPLPENGKKFCDWISGRQNQKGEREIIFKERKGLYYAFLRLITGKSYKEEVEKTGRFGRFYSPDGQKESGDETISVGLDIDFANLGPVGQANGSRTYNFQLYLGPKDKSLFDKNDLYRKLGFVQTIDFMACCCPASIINPLAFGILAIMKWMYGFPPHNYGVVIIILVFLVRLAMHPITRMSQVSMSKFSKLAPKAEELKKKYANNKAELNKQLMQLYRKQGASPIMSFLPMMVQMPIWIALYSAIYASIELRGAPFLPFWITDLSAPDAVVRFSTITVPLFSWKINSLNLLPILMGVAFYLQQKLMPSQTPAAASPQAAQQQKMMMVMMTGLFPLMLYRAPSGLNLYIMASTFAGVVEQYVIRKHIRKKEEAES
ncbi:MAG: YidC/Oxa1 family insertase periplasmic-domain containing protein, partial [Planctomycetota bacterium]|nr:YidC/Oxa1 family insertase periplasmic-domain containing protein [Planctomycetota bacterium]